MAEVRCFPGDIDDAASVEDWLQDCRPESVIHLAAKVAVDYVSEKPFSAWRTNVEGLPIFKWSGQAGEEAVVLLRQF
jgi:FlaA1/EpsC-like NDP-sugar epimerase